MRSQAQLSKESLLSKLLTRRSQYDGKSLRYNHEAIALLLQHRNKTEWHLDQLYLAAGSEDVRAILPKLDLNDNGSEAFIYVRPYVHSMLIYFRRDANRLQIYVFDSQGWGLRYYPTRLLLQVLSEYFRECHVYLTNKEVQSQDEQEGCVEYVMSGINYLAREGESLMQSLNIENCQVLDRYRNCWQITTDSFTDSMTTVDTLQSKNNHMQMLKLLLQTKYRMKPTWLQMAGKLFNAKEDACLTLNNDAINKTVQFLAGMERSNLREVSLLSCCTISVMPEQAKISLCFKNKDYLYANFLVYSDALYPGFVNAAQTSFRFILQDHSDVRIEHDHDNNSLHYYGKSIKQLQAAFTELPLKVTDIYQSHMRQQLALISFVDQVNRCIELECELAVTTRNATGGLDIWQTQNALEYLLQGINTVVYVPSWDEISGDAGALDINALRGRGYAYIVYAQQLDHEEHQVGIRVDITSDTPRAYVYNSLDNEKLSELFFERQWKLLGTQCDIVSVPSHFSKQNDDWSCAVHVISNLLSACGMRDSMMTPVLPVVALARRYLAAWQARALRSEQTAREFKHYIHRVFSLLSAIQEAKTIFKPLQILIKQKLVKLSIDDVSKFISGLVVRYSQIESANRRAIILLHYIGITYPSFNQDQLNRLFTLTCYIKESHYCKEENDFIALIETEFQLALNGKLNKSNFCIQVLNVLLNSESSSMAIQNFQEQLDCDYSLDSLDKNYILSRILQRVCKDTYELHAAQSSEVKRQHLEAQARAQQAEQCAESLGLNSVLRQEFVQELLIRPRNIMIFTMPLVVNILKILESDEERQNAIKLMQRCQLDSPTMLIRCCPEKYQMAMFKQFLAVRNRRSLNFAVAGMSDEQALIFANDHLANIQDYCRRHSHRRKGLEEYLEKFDCKLASLVISVISECADIIERLSVKDLLLLLRRTNINMHFKIMLVYKKKLNEISIKDFKNILDVLHVGAWQVIS